MNPTQFQTDHIIDISSSSDENELIDLSTRKARWPRVQRKPLVEISSSDESSTSVQSTSLSFSLHCDSSNVSSNDDGDDDAGEIYDWLDVQTLSQLSLNKSESQLQSSGGEYYATPSRPKPLRQSRTSFSPPGLKSPLDKNCLQQTCKPNVKDTMYLKKQKAHLPQKKPEVVTKGNWLTNRTVVNDYILLHSLGKGAYGEVKLCKEKKSNQLFAMKAINKTRNNNGIGEQMNHDDDIKMEIAIMKRCRHPNVVTLFEVIDDPRSSTLYLVLEYMKQGDLMSIIQREFMTDEQTWDILAQVASGLTYLHDNNIVHGDIKPSNLLVASDGTVKLSDFGISKIKNDGELLQDYQGTPAFMAPEVVSGIRYNGKLSDMYSIGATIFCVRFGRPVFSARSRHELHHKILNDPVQFPDEAKAMVSNALLQLIKALIMKEPELRMSLDKVMAHINSSRGGLE